MMRTGLLLSASVATLFARRAAADCTACISGATPGTFCAYETSDNNAAGYGICYKDALGNNQNCPEVYGALDLTYGADNELTATQYDNGGADCSTGAQTLADANIATFDDKTAGDAVTDVTTCAACINDSNTWCQPKDAAGAYLAGGYCSAGRDCITLLESASFDSMEPITDTCPTTPTDAPTNPCGSCIADGKLFCAYSTGTGSDKTYLYHACIGGRTCPTMTGIDAIYAGLKQDTKVKSDSVDQATDCAGMTLPTDAGLNLANVDMTEKTTCSDCVSNGKWCSYDATTVKGGYCGVEQTCAKLEDFANTSIVNVPDTREPTTDCDSPSAGFALTSSNIALATCAAALAISA